MIQRKEVCFTFTEVSSWLWSKRLKQVCDGIWEVCWKTGDDEVYLVLITCHLAIFSKPVEV